MQKTNNNGKKLDVRAFLSGKTKTNFEEIKEDAGFENNTEALRFIINDYHKLKFRGSKAKQTSQTTSHADRL